MLTPRKRWIMIVVSAPMILMAALILLSSGLSPEQAWAQTESGITSPASGSAISGTVIIMGTAVDPNFDRYELAYKPEPSGEDAYIYLSEGAESVLDGQLAVWQTEDLAPGEYSLRLRVVRIDGNYDEFVATNLTVGAAAEEPTPTPEETATPLPPTATPVPTQPAASPTTPPTAAPTLAATATVVAAPETDTAAVTETVEVDVEADLAPISVEVVGGDEAALRIFLRSLLASFTMGPATEAVTATIGELPPLPIELDLPASVAVVGSVVRTGDFGSTQIYFAPPVSAVDILDDVRVQLADQGFTSPQTVGTMGEVFLSNQPDVSLLCRTEDDLFANVGIASLNNTVILQISLLPIQPGASPCSPDPTQAGMGPGYGILPQLQPLAGARVQGSGGSSSGDRISATADIQTDLTADVVAAHYEDQLDAAGWERIEETAADAIAWSAWTFTDEDDNEWNGTFYIVRLAGDGDSYVATLDAQQQR